MAYINNAGNYDQVDLDVYPGYDEVRTTLTKTLLYRFL